MGVTDAGVPANGMVAAGGGVVNSRSDPGGFISGTFPVGQKMAIREGTGVAGTLVEDEDTLAITDVLPLLVDMRHGCIRHL